MSNRDEIVQATILIRTAIEATKVANSALLPSATLAAQGTRTNDDWNVLDPEGNNDWTLTGVLTWTFNMFRNNSTVKEKREAVNELVLARQQLVQDISQNVKIAYLNMKTSEGNIDDYRRAVATRTENFRLFQMRYQQGDVSFTDVLIAENRACRRQGQLLQLLDRLQNQSGHIGKSNGNTQALAVAKSDASIFLN